jgi:hypothetical protein
MNGRGRSPATAFQLLRFRQHQAMSPMGGNTCRFAALPAPAARRRKRTPLRRAYPADSRAGHGRTAPAGTAGRGCGRPQLTTATISAAPSPTAFPFSRAAVGRDRLTTEHKSAQEPERLECPPSLVQNSRADYSADDQSAAMRACTCRFRPARIRITAISVKRTSAARARWIPARRSARMAITAPRSGMPTVTATR